MRSTSVFVLLVVTGGMGCGEASPSPADAAMGDSGVDASLPLVDAGDRADGGLSDGGSDDDATVATDADVDAVVLPPANASFDYQLGGAYPPPTGVEVVSRDRTEAPASGLYNLCYVNGFQTQPDERTFWERDHPDLLLRDASGDPVIDPDWDEILLDVTSAEKRARLAGIVGGWIDGCADDGFDAVEIDNLDTYARSGGRISQDDAVAFMRLLSDRAHARGLAMAQKNSTEILGRRSEMGTDFAVAEECNRYAECDEYVAVYSNLVFVIEYARGDFDRGCSAHPDLSIVLRDLLLRTPGSGYVFDGC